MELVSDAGKDRKGPWPYLMAKVAELLDVNQYKVLRTPNC